MFNPHNSTDFPPKSTQKSPAYEISWGWNAVLEGSCLWRQQDRSLDFGKELVYSRVGRRAEICCNTDRSVKWSVIFSFSLQDGKRKQPNTLQSKFNWLCAGVHWSCYGICRHIFQFSFTHIDHRLSVPQWGCRSSLLLLCVSVCELSSEYCKVTRLLRFRLSPRQP